MYKIWINNTPLFLCSLEELKDRPAADEKNMTARYPGKSKILLSYADMLEKSDRFDSVTLYSERYDQLVQDFFSNYNLIEAAGGVVFNEEQQVLAIYRRGSWDLPKGKIDPGETPEQAALREVEEETGIQGLEAGDLMRETYHTYRHPKHGRILKRTYWYRMSAPRQALIPQAEEEIEIAQWMPVAALLQTDRELYGNIRDMLQLIDGYQ